MSRKYLMSPVQMRLYAIDLLQEKNITYNIPIMLKIKGFINVDKLEETIQILVERHEVFRTYFMHSLSKFYQIIEDRVEIPLLRYKRENSNFMNLFEEFVRPFELGRAPLIRAFYIESKDGNILLIDIHHIIFDGGSVQTLLNDLKDIYNDKTLPKPRVQYKDFSAWQRMQEISKQEEYWAKQFQEEIPVLNLPLDFKRPQYQTFVGHTLQSTLHIDEAKKIKKLCRSSGTTEFVVFLASVMILLSRYSGQSKLVVGTAVSGRTHPESQSMLGMFVNTLALVGKIDEEKTFIEFLNEMKEKCLNALDNQDYAFDKLVEKLDVKRDTSRNPLFDVMFTVQNDYATRLALGEAILEPIDFEHNIAKFDLTLTVVICKDSYELMLEYNTSLFKESSIKLMLERYQTLLTNITYNPEIPIKELNILKSSERDLVLENFIAMEQDYPDNKSIYEIFEKQVEMFPDKIAIQNNDGEFTYQELKNKIEIYADILSFKGIIAGDLITVMAEKRLETIIAIIAILKCGAAYIPIDTKYPLERIKYILNDSNSKYLLVYDKLNYVSLSDVASLLEINVEDNCRRYSKDYTYLNASPQSAAHVIYTSGTTGESKGVIISHRSVICMAKNLNYVDFGKVCMLQTGSLAFDASTFEIWGTLLNGGTLYFAENDMLSDIGMMKSLIKEKAINTMFLTTALLNQLVTLDVSVFDEIKTLFFGGEATSEEHVKTLVRHNNIIKLVELYGPTEATVFVTSYVIKPQNVNSKIPIGKPVSNTSIYILSQGHLCGVGVPGEICIGGPRIANGYLNKPEITKDKFICNPYCKGETIYRTGDLGRWLEDGNIVYLGRMDNQVKIHGFRIELGEIESRIREIHGIEDVAVVVRTFNQDKYICAYIVAKDISIEKIKEQLSTQLPDYMLPSFFTMLTEMPVTKNGKVDKDLLPIPEIKSSSEYIAPSNKAELEVVNIFEEVLMLEKIGVKDSFYDFGGNSIKAIHIVSKLKELGYNITARSIMQHKTPEVIARELNKSKKSSLKQYTLSEIAKILVKETNFKIKCHEITIEEQLYKIIFVNGLTEEKKYFLIKCICQRFGSQNMPDYIFDNKVIDYNKLFFSADSIDKYLNQILKCQDSTIPDIIETDVYLDDIVSTSYQPTVIQTYYLEMMPWNIIEAKFDIIGNYTKEYVINIIEKILEEQQVLRLAYLKQENDFLFNEFELIKNSIPYLDLINASEGKKNIILNLFENKDKWKYQMDSRNLLSRIFITKDSEVKHTVHLSVSHCIWDETSTHIMKERIDALLTKKEELSNVERYSNYMKEVELKIKTDLNTEEFIQKILREFIKECNFFMDYNRNKSLVKLDYAIVKMGPHFFQKYQENIWDTLCMISNMIIEKNELVSRKNGKYPMFILQENRRYMKKDYSNTMGALLDIIPIISEKEIFIGKTIEQLQSSKKNSHIIFSDYLMSISKCLEFSKIPSINYHGIYQNSFTRIDDMKIMIEKSWNETYKVLDNFGIDKYYEINVHVFNDVLFITYPVYNHDLCSIGVSLQNKIDELELKEE